MFREVATECLHWCAGYKIQKMDFCLVSSARDIMSCFREGNKFLPSPPVNVHVQTIYSNDHISINWEDSEKNKDSTHWYWVYWKKVGTNEMDRERVERNNFELTNLEPDSTYEFVVKTSNYHGTSVLSKPLVINLSHMKMEYLTSESRIISNVFLTFFLFLLVAASVAFAAYWSYKNNYLAKFRSSTSGNGSGNIGVSFENHAYNLEDTIQMQDTSTPTPVVSNGNGFRGSNQAATDLFNSDQNNNPNGQQPRVQIRMN